MTKKDKKLKTNSDSTLPIFSQTFTPEVNAEIRRAATTGIYDIRAVSYTHLTLPTILRV